MTIFDEIIDQLYAAALDDRGLPAALQAASRWVDAVGIDMSQLVKAAGLVTNYSTLEDDCIGEYIAHYYTVNPRPERALHTPPRTIFSDLTLMTTREVDLSEFHQDYLRRYELGDFMGTILDNNSSRWSYAAFVFDTASGAPSSRQVTRFRRLAQHLRRLLDKTGTRRQGELVALLWRAATTVRDRGPDPG
ncbi:MAG: hypothetical protein AB7Q81_09700 [Gammaproteobacteria bacterium]